MSTTTWETIVEQYKERAVRDGARIDELRQSTEHWHDTAQMLKRQRDMAEQERDEWKIRAMASEQQRQALRAESEALRKVYEAAKAWRSAWLIATRIGGKEAVVLLESRCIALDEAVAERVVQPTTGGEDE
jgi:hypothetical protein